MMLSNNYYLAGNQTLSLAQQYIQETVTNNTDTILNAFGYMCVVADSLLEMGWYGKCLVTGTAVDCAPYVLKSIYNQFHSVIFDGADSFTAVVSGVEKSMEAVWSTSCIRRPGITECAPFALKKISNHVPSLINGQITPFMRDTISTISSLSFAFAINKCVQRHWTHCAKGISAFVTTQVFNHLLS